jgi:hypothetical protein
MSNQHHNRQPQHTPAPWYFKKDSNAHEGKIYRKRYYSFQGEERFVEDTICDFGYGDEDNQTAGGAPEGADLCLLLAAPEMLARLEQALEYLEHPDVVNMGFAKCSSVMATQVREAITKARSIA